VKSIKEIKRNKKAMGQDIILGETWRKRGKGGEQEVEVL